MKKRQKHDPAPFRSIKTEIKQLTETGIPEIPKLAFTDPDFLLRRELRPVRLMLEHMKPELTLREDRIKSTIVIFGSARLCEPKIAKLNLAAAKRKLKANPKNKKLLFEVKIAKKVLARSHVYDEARKLAQIITYACQQTKRKHFVIITGGGPGIMEAANRGAYDVNGKSIGLNIMLPMEQAPNPYISPDLNFQFHYFAMRKMHFLIRARALIAFPGGYGTLDELFEALTLLQTKKIRPIPILLFDKSYWSKVIKFDFLVDEGMIAPEDVKLFQCVETAKEAWQAILDFYHLKPEDLK